VRYSSTAGRWVIAATVLGSAMATIDSTVVGIALPRIGRQFHAAVGGVQWVVTGYALTLSALLLLGGSLGDHYGRRRAFDVGVVWFTAASIGCALAPDISVLIVMRALQGVGAALLTPGSLAIIEASFDPGDRGRAIGAWSGLGGLAIAAGPLVGGFLIAAASWRWIFIINAPIGAAVLAVSARHVPESKDPGAPRKLDLIGAAAGTLALAGITYGLIEGPAIGWAAPAVVAMLVAGTGAAAAFLVVERRSAAPMLPLTVFRLRQFTVTNAATFLIYAALGGVLFLLPVELQVADRYSPLEAGLSLLPLTAVMLALSARSGRIASRIGPRLQMTVGPLVVATGLVLLLRVTSDPTYASGVLPALLLFALGLAITVAPLTATALSALPGERAGLASAFNNDVARLGGLIAVAVLPVLSGISGSDYLRAAKLSAGFKNALVIAAACCAVAGIVSALGIRNPPRVTGAMTPHEAVAAESPAYRSCALDGPPLTRTCPSATGG
jgi:EmrB/QacA subfamily drug resistance transporter